MCYCAVAVVLLLLHCCHCCCYIVSTLCPYLHSLRSLPVNFLVSCHFSLYLCLLRVHSFVFSLLIHSFSFSIVPSCSFRHEKSNIKFRNVNDNDDDIFLHLLSFSLWILSRFTHDSFNFAMWNAKDLWSLNAFWKTKSFWTIYASLLV